MHYIPRHSDSDRPPRHAFLCFYKPGKPGKHSSRLYVYDPMTKVQAGWENNREMWSLSIFRKLYEDLKKPTVTFRYGASRGSDCLWQSLRELDRIIKSPTAFDKFTR